MIKIISQRLALLVLASTFFVSPQLALAVENSFFLGFSIGESTIDISRGDMTAALDDGSVSGARLDNEATSFKLIGGYWLNNYVGVELGYIDLAELNYSAVSDGSGFLFSPGAVTADAEVDAILFGVVGRLPVNDWFELAGRFGIFNWNLEVEVSNAGASGRADEGGNDIYYGIGAAFRVNKQLSIGLDFDRYDLDGDDIDVISVGLRYNFR